MPPTVAASTTMSSTNANTSSALGNEKKADLPAVADAIPTASNENENAPQPTFAFVPPPLISTVTTASSSENSSVEVADEAAEGEAEPPARDEYAELLARSTPEEKVALGRQFLREDQLDKAVDSLAIALEDYVAKYGDFSLHCAVVYRSYGDALLKHYQKNSSVLGDVVANDEEKKKKLLGDEADEDAEEEEVAAPTADSDDLELSYQVLETARVIYAKHYHGPGKVEESKTDEEGAKAEEEKEAAAAAASSSSASSSSAPAAPVDTSLPPLTEKEIGLALAYTYEILASFFMEKEDFASAYADYNKALQISEALLPPHARDVAALHMDLAVCALFDNQPEKALTSYQAARAVFQLTVAHLEEEIKKEEANPTPVPVVAATVPTTMASSSSSSASATTPAPTPAAPATPLQKLKDELADCKDILDELKERIEDITSQLALPAADQALSLVKQQTASNAPAANPFAVPAAASSFNPFAVPETAPAAAAAAASPAAASANSTPAVTHAPQVKRKVKPTPVAAASTPAAASSAAAVVDRSQEGEEGESAAKRQKQ